MDLIEPLISNKLQKPENSARFKLKLTMRNCNSLILQPSAKQHVIKLTTQEFAPGNFIVTALFLNFMWKVNDAIRSTKVVVKILKVLEKWIKICIE